MGYLDDSKITSTDVSAVHVGMQPDRLTGTVAENKQAFDNYPDMIRAKINAGYDVISTKDAAQDTRLTAIEAYETTWNNEVTAATNAANTATSNANTATSAANTATSNANTATSAANTATANANTAKSNAETATAAANTATSNANAATSAATSAASEANTATANANTATDNTNAAIASANTATGNTNAAIASANTAATAANTSASNADAAASSANSAATTANNATKYVWIRFSASADGTSFHTPSVSGDTYIGTAITSGNSAPTLKTDYVWSQMKGDKGDTGSAATIGVGTTTTGAAGSSAIVSNSGTSSAATFNFTIPRGDKGERGTDGTSFQLKGMYATLSELETTHPSPAVGDAYGVGTSDSNVVYLYSDSSTWANMGALKGAKGDAGTSATVNVGSTTTGDAGTSASVTNSGSESAAVFNFTIPKGDKGDKGEYATIDPALSSTSENPVQNKVIMARFSSDETTINDKAAKATTLSGYGITDAYTKTQADSLLGAKQGTLTFDSTPTSGSTNPVTSGGLYTSLSGKAAATHTHTKSQITDFPVTTKVAATLNASSWSENTYSFENLYPVATYDIEIEPASTITATQLKAWNKAQIVGDNDSNVATAIGTVPTIDIPIIIKVVAL